MIRNIGAGSKMLPALFVCRPFVCYLFREYIWCLTATFGNMNFACFVFVASFKHKKNSSRGEKTVSAIHQIERTDRLFATPPLPFDTNNFVPPSTTARRLEFSWQRVLPILLIWKWKKSGAEYAKNRPPYATHCRPKGCADVAKRCSFLGFLCTAVAILSHCVEALTAAPMGLSRHRVRPVPRRDSASTATGVGQNGGLEGQKPDRR